MKRVALILSENYADWEGALVAAVLRSFYGVEVKTASPDGKNITSAAGLHVTPDMAIANIDPDAFDMLIVNGGSAWEGDAAPDIGDLVRHMRAKGKPVAAICAAVRALASAGLLDAEPHTGNSRDELASLAGYGGGAHYRDQKAAVSGAGLITAAGTAPVSFMKEICIALGFGGPQLDFYVGLLGAEHAAA